MRVVLIFFLATLPINVLLAQKSIRGTVKDASGLPITGAYVVAKGTTNGTATDIDGKFTLEVSESDITLEISYTGFETQDVNIERDTVFNIILKEGKELDEVVVTALGVTQKKEQLTYSIETISPRELNNSRIGDVGQQLSGQVAGLDISTNNSSGVSSSRIVLRGESSLNIDKNQPLIVVDGTLISNTYIGVGQSSVDPNDPPVDYGNALTDLNPDDFADVSVLKGPKAAALYGSRASNGVLLIRTKRERKEGIGVAYSTGVSFDVVNRFWDEQFDYGGGGQRTEGSFPNVNYINNQYRQNWGGNFGPRTSGQAIAQTTSLNPSATATPFLQQADRKGFFETGYSFNNHIALSFDNKSSWGRVSYGNLTKKGFVPNTDYNKNTINANLGFQVTDKLKLETFANYIISGSDNVADIGYGNSGLMYNMLWIMKNFEINKDYWVQGREFEQQNNPVSWATNPYLIVNENTNAFEHDRVFGNLKTTYEFTKNLSLFFRIALDTYSDLRVSKRAKGQPRFPTGMYREQNVYVRELNTDFYATYNKQIQDFNVQLNFGGNQYIQTINHKTTQSSNLAIANIYNFTNAIGTPRSIQYDAERRINSFYGSAQGGYKGMLFLEITARNDWSSTLPLDSNSFFYPSIGISAIISEMAELPKFISLAKLRASYAQTGNDTGPFLTNNNYQFGAISASITNSNLLAKPDLKPEETSAIEIGADLKFLDDRVSFTIDYYRNDTRNQILQTPISYSSGATAQLINAGKIVSSGLEWVLRGDAVATKDFNWNVILNWQTNSASVETLAEGVDSFIIAQGPEGSTVEARPGGQMGDIYGRGFVRTANGTIVYDIIDGIPVPKLSTNTKKVGNYNPDWTLGFTNSFTYKNINLRVFLDYRQGGSFYSLTGSQLYRSGSITETLEFREKDNTFIGAIQNADGTYTEQQLTSPGYQYYRNYYTRTNIEANTYDATFLKLREISVGVNLKGYFSKIPFSNFSASIFARNLYTWTKEDFVRHFDPEVLTFRRSSYVKGFEVGQLPGTAVYGLNIKIQL